MNFYRTLKASITLAKYTNSNFFYAPEATKNISLNLSRINFASENSVNSLIETSAHEYGYVLDMFRQWNHGPEGNVAINEYLSKEINFEKVTENALNHNHYWNYLKDNSFDGLMRAFLEKIKLSSLIKKI